MSECLEGTQNLCMSVLEENTRKFTIVHLINLFQVKLDSIRCFYMYSVAFKQEQ